MKTRSVFTCMILFLFFLVLGCTVDQSETSASPGITPQEDQGYEPTETYTSTPALSGSGGGIIAFSSLRDNANGDEVYVMNADGSGQTRLTDNYSMDMAASWSPDGTQIAFMSSRFGNPDVFIMNADGSNPTRLTTSTADDIWPAWSPDGDHIAFNSNRDGNYEIYVMNADGSDQQRLTLGTANNYDPAWSPDGQMIIFDSDRDALNGDGTQIYVMNADGSNVLRLTDLPGYNTSPVYSPNGGRIAFMCGSIDEGGPFICLMDADGQNISQLDIGDGDGWSPSWSPDGLQIAFYSYRPGPFYDGKLTAIYVVNIDGTGLQQLTDLETHSLHPTWGPLP